MEGTLAILLIFGLPIVAILSGHWRKVQELKLQSRSDDKTLRAIEELRAEVAELRDTATRFDLSFDTALQRLESRVQRLEERALEARAAESRVGPEQ